MPGRGRAAGGELPEHGGVQRWDCRGAVPGMLWVRCRGCSAEGCGVCCRGAQRARRGRVPGRRCLCPFPGPEGQPRKTFSPRFGAAALCCSGGKPLSEPLALRHRGWSPGCSRGWWLAAGIAAPPLPVDGRPGEGCVPAGGSSARSPCERLWALGCGGSSCGDPALKVYRGARVFRIFQRDRPSGMWWEFLTSMLRKTKDFPFTGWGGGIKQNSKRAKTNKRCSRRTKVSLWQPACRNVNETPP